MNELSDKRVLITGAAGFIGANLTRELIRCGAKVHALVRPCTRLWKIAEIVPPVILHPVNVTDFPEVQRVVSEIRPEVIFHLAAPGGHPSRRQDRDEMLRTIVLGTANILEAVETLDYQRFIHVCSSTAYGPKNRPLKEADLLRPVTFRGAAKAAASLLCQQRARASERPIVVLRPFSVYGYWESATRLIPTAILAALRNQEISLTAPGYRRDLIFVPDVVEACLLALRAKSVAGEVINIGSGQQWSNEEVVDMVGAVCGCRIKVHAGVYPASPSDTTYWVADIQKGKRLLRWEPRHSLRRGLEKTISWFRLHQDAYWS